LLPAQATEQTSSSINTPTRRRRNKTSPTNGSNKTPAGAPHPLVRCGTVAGDGTPITRDTSRSPVFAAFEFPATADK